jgi:integrase
VASGSGGSVRRRRDGRWEGRYVGMDRRRHSVYASTRRDAQERLRVAFADEDRGVPRGSKLLTVRDFLDDWLRTSVAVRCRTRTVESYRETVARYVIPAIGHLRLAKVEPRDVSRMLTALTDRHDLSPTTVHYVHTVLRIALGHAVRLGLVGRNVAMIVDAPSRARPEQHPLTAQQARIFLGDVAHDRLGPLYSIAIATGMRQGELLGLRWGDVDLDRGTVAVRHALRRGDRVLTDPKTDRARRTIRLAPDFIETLRQHRVRQLEDRLAAGDEWSEGGYVFTTRIGRPLHGRNVLTSLHAALAKSGLPRQRFHDLRHAYATLMLEDGEELVVVSRNLGHTNTSTTADIYAHVTAPMAERSAARIESILRTQERAG